jgi:hypothetical protein
LAALHDPLALVAGEILITRSLPVIAGVLYIVAITAFRRPCRAADRAIPCAAACQLWRRERVVKANRIARLKVCNYSLTGDSK